MFAKTGRADEPVGVIVLRSNAQQFLYPLVQSWPTPSRSAETLLVRRDGDSGPFLNDLRYKKDAALRLRIPLSHKQVPAVLAVMGTKGVFRGKDYRGVDVLSALQGVPDSPWFIVAKVDAEEALATWRFDSVLILVITGPLIALAAVATGLMWQRNGRMHYQSLAKAQAELRESEENLAITLHSIGDAVISTDANGRVVSMNPVAEELPDGPFPKQSHCRSPKSSP